MSDLFDSPEIREKFPILSTINIPDFKDISDISSSDFSEFEKGNFLSYFESISFFIINEIELLENYVSKYEQFVIKNGKLFQIGQEIQKSLNYLLELDKKIINEFKNNDRVCKIWNYQYNIILDKITDFIDKMYELEREINLMHLRIYNQNPKKLLNNNLYMRQIAMIYYYEGWEIGTDYNEQRMNEIAKRYGHKTGKTLYFSHFQQIKDENTRLYELSKRRTLKYINGILDELSPSAKLKAKLDIEKVNLRKN